MLIGYVRVSKVDGSQNLDLQIDALFKAGVNVENIYQEQASGKKSDRPQLESCLKALRKDDTLVVWKLDRLGRSLHDLVKIVKDLSEREVGLRVLTTNIDTTTPTGKLFFGFFAVLAEFESDLISERTKAGLLSARARGKKGGRAPGLTKAQVRLAQAAMSNRDTVVSQLSKELGVTRATLYKYVSPDGELRELGKQVLNMK